MGAWGTGNFENDDALDWVSDLEQTADTSLIVQSLKTTTEPGDTYLDAPACCAALAAAEVVAALNDVGSPGLPDEVKQWVADRQNTGAPVLTQLALNALKHIRANSELKELWEESEEAQAWYNVLDELERRLKRNA